MTFLTRKMLTRRTVLKGVPTVERYRYLYSPQELTPWVERIEEVAAEAERTVVLYNNCYGNYGTTNARETIARLAAS